MLRFYQVLVVCCGRSCPQNRYDVPLLCVGDALVVVLLLQLLNQSIARTVLCVSRHVGRERHGNAILLLHVERRCG